MSWPTYHGIRRLPNPHEHRCYRCGTDLNTPRCDGGLHQCNDCAEVERQTARYEKWMAQGKTEEECDILEARVARRTAAAKRRDQEKREKATHDLAA